MQARWVPPWCSLFSIFPVIYHLDILRSEAEFPNGEFKCVIKVSHKDGLLEPVFKYGQWKITVNLTSSQIKVPHTVSAFFPHRVRWFFEILIHFFFLNPSYLQTFVHQQWNWEYIYTQYVYIYVHMQSHTLPISQAGWKATQVFKIPDTVLQNKFMM